MPSGHKNHRNCKWIDRNFDHDKCDRNLSLSHAGDAYKLERERERKSERDGERDYPVWPLCGILNVKSDTLALALVLGRHPRSSGLWPVHLTLPQTIERTINFPFWKPKDGGGKPLDRAHTHTLLTYVGAEAEPGPGRVGYGARKVIARTPPKTGRTNGHGQKRLC